ncbi:unnamed protein product [Tetraodon nigroviridis]|uniref:Chromosome undetermined SCAF2396, whole genome shotgun sequence n=1 Tax=Tetraodon nigroviridis TaxID=99883 RepID=Q4TI54_TETNG|nr:unnamed protein product [Tetraodon nigroviridis]
MGGSRTGPFCGTEEVASLCPVRDWWDQRSALAQRAEAELEMLRFSLVGKQGHWTRSEDIRGTAHVRGAEVREARLRWLGMSRGETVDIVEAKNQALKALPGEPSPQAGGGREDRHDHERREQQPAGHTCPQRHGRTSRGRLKTLRRW